MPMICSPCRRSRTMQLRLSVKWLCGLIGMACVWFLIMFLYLNDLFSDEVKGRRERQDLDRSLILDLKVPNLTSNLSNASRNRYPGGINLNAFHLKVPRPPEVILPVKQYPENSRKGAFALVDLNGNHDHLNHLKDASRKNRKKRRKQRMKKQKLVEKPAYIRSNRTLLNGQRLNRETVTYLKINSTLKLAGNLEGDGIKGSEANRRELGSSRVQAPFKQRGAMVYVGYSESRDLQDDLADGMNRHSFNVTLSQRLPLNRAVPDYRPAGCMKTVPEIEDFPSVSVVICFHNEALSTLLRTVWSVLHHTPNRLLEDIILVDDNSTFDYLGKELSSYLRHWPKVKLFRTHKREGLVRARLLGVSHTKGQVLVFLDSHCECNTDWLLPLLKVIQSQPTKVAVPEIDIIDPDTLAYMPAPGQLHGSFDWDLNFVWKTLPWEVQPNMMHLPFRTPTMIGGVFAIAKQFFTHLGGYDPGFEIWGGENIQLSFKVWQCGGSIEILPCSRVGHIFRRVMPYGFPAGGKATIQRNAVRVAEVWMDEYRAFFYASQNVSRRNFGRLALGRQHSLRSSLQCRDFHWYLTQVLPELPLPTNNTQYYGQIKSVAAHLCLHSLEGDFDLSGVTVKDCLTQHPAQMFQLSVTGQLSQHHDCLTVNSRKKVVKKPCNQVFQTWSHTPGYQMSTLTAKGAKVCLALSKQSNKLELQPCFDEHKVPGAGGWNLQIDRQYWHFTHHFDMRQLANHYN